MTSIITFDLHSHTLERKILGSTYWHEANARQIDVMAITEHAHFNPEKAFELVAQNKPKNKLLIPGIELNTNIGHVLCLAPSKKIYKEKKFLEYDLPIEDAAALAEQHDCLLSCAHPWGFQHDSAGFRIGTKKLLKLMKGHQLGVEAYNGMVGHLSDFIYESGWVRRPVNFFDFLKKNRVTQKVGLARIGKGLSKRAENQIWTNLSRVNAAIKLGERANFVTAGSDAHVAERIGEGMLKIKTKEKPRSTNEAFKLIKQKEQVVWCGVGVDESAPGIYKKIPRKKIARWELWNGIKYAAKRAVSEKVLKTIKRKQKKGRT